MKLPCRFITLAAVLLCTPAAAAQERNAARPDDKFIVIEGEGSVVRIPGDDQFPGGFNRYNCDDYFVASPARPKASTDDGARAAAPKRRRLDFGFDEPNPRGVHADAVCVLTPVGKNGFYVQQFRRIHLPNTSKDLSGYRLCKDPGEGVAWTSANLADQQTPCGFKTGKRGCTPCGDDVDKDGKPDVATGSVKLTSH